MRWDVDRVLRLVATPCNERHDALDTIEAEEDPHSHPASEQLPDEPDASRAKRRLKIDQGFGPLWLFKCLSEMPSVLSESQV